MQTCGLYLYNKPIRGILMSLEDDFHYNLGCWVKKHLVHESYFDDILAEADMKEKTLTEVIVEGRGNDCEKILNYYPGVIPVILIPDNEFNDMVFSLPEFFECPIMYVAWHSLSSPTKFIVKSLKDGDMLGVDTQGYEYARYKAFVCEVVNITQVENINE
jgi:hypothetical protein